MLVICQRTTNSYLTLDFSRIHTHFHQRRRAAATWYPWRSLDPVVVQY